ncbi:MAG TPA: hypothetical protein VL053_13500 [Arachidicoccus sp.]|nr:hypothetical protein [Arachidicoccus sp.]
MMKTLLLILISFATFGCSKDHIPEAQNIEPFINISGRGLYGYDIGSEMFTVYNKDFPLYVEYGSMPATRIKAFTYKIEIGKTINARYDDGHRVFFFVTGDVKYQTIKEGKVQSKILKGDRLSLKEELKDIDLGGFSVKLTTVCDGETKESMVTFCSDW